jgi:hypothetical protein
MMCRFSKTKQLKGKIFQLHDHQFAPPPPNLMYENIHEPHQIKKTKRKTNKQKTTTTTTNKKKHMKTIQVGPNVQSNASKVKVESM